MNKKIGLVILVAIAILAYVSNQSVVKNQEKLVHAAETQKENLGQVLPITAKAEIDGEVIELEVAKTPEQQALGLMFRESLPAKRGMLFPFKPAKITQFWMVNCLISLDMIFLRDGQIQAIAANVPPCNTAPQDCPIYGPSSTLIDQVIELRGGRAAELDLQPGDRLKVEFLNVL
jgi:hypothetical protein